MPLFEYRCPQCGCVDERLVRAPAPESVTCSACGSTAQRLVPLMASRAADCDAVGGGGT